METSLLKAIEERAGFFQHQKYGAIFVEHVTEMFEELLPLALAEKRERNLNAELLRKIEVDIETILPDPALSYVNKKILQGIVAGIHQIQNRRNLVTFSLVENNYPREGL